MSLRIVIHNVGHGQAIHAFTPANQTVVIDLGCSAEFSPLSWLRRTTRVIDSLIITHPHGDHIEEMLELNTLEFEVRQFWRPKWLPRDEVYNQNQSGHSDRLDSYFDMSDRYSTPIPQNELVGNPAVSGGLSIEKFAAKSCAVSNINNHSGVIIFEYVGVKVILPGDNEPPSWRALVEQGDFSKAIHGADVFMASHHGRESGYCPDLFKDWKPTLCVISDSRSPDTDATSRYSHHARGWAVLRRRAGSSATRSCVTTRSDGFIEIEIGKNRDGEVFLSVGID